MFEHSNEALKYPVLKEATFCQAGLAMERAIHEWYCKRRYMDAQQDLELLPQHRQSWCRSSTGSLRAYARPSLLG